MMQWFDICDRPISKSRLTNISVEPSVDVLIIYILFFLMSTPKIIRLFGTMSIILKKKKKNNIKWKPQCVTSWRVGWLLSLVTSPSNIDALDWRPARWAKPRHQYLTDRGWYSTINHLTPRGYISLLWAFSKPWLWIIAHYSRSVSWLLFLLIKVKSQAW